MYEELVKQLWECVSGDCFNCSQYKEMVAQKNCEDNLMKQAADAIEELQAKFTAEHDLRVKALNRLCGWCGVCSKENRDAIGCDDIAQLDEVHAPRWISVEERLPDDNEAVNITWINRSPVIYYQDIKDKPQTATGVYFRGHWYWWSGDVQDYLAEYGKWDCDKMDDAIEVTHWMPLPQPPKEET